MRFLRTFHVAAVNSFPSFPVALKGRRCASGLLVESWRCAASTTSSSFAKQRGREEKVAERASRRAPSLASTLAEGSERESIDDDHRHGEYRKAYSKVGYDFVENIRTSHPNFIINQTRMSLLFYSVAACTIGMYVIYYFTTYTYVLTNNPKPFINSMFQHYPCDYAVIENRWTGRKSVVEVEPLEEGESTATSDHGTTAGRTPTTRKMYINSLLDRVYLYVQKSHSVVQWDAAKELVPDRFISKKLLHNVASENAFSSRATVAVRRKDQLLDPRGEAQAQQATPSRRLFGRARQDPNQAPQGATTPQGAAKMPRLLVTSTVRAQDKTNGDVQGNLPAYEEMIKTTLHELLVSRYYECMLRQKVQPGVSAVFAREMIANGTVDGSGIRWEDVVPSVDALEAEIRTKVESLVGNDIIIYDFHISCLLK